MKLFILGAGTLGRFIADIVHDCADMRVSGFLDDRYPAMKEVGGIPVVGTFDDADPKVHSHIAIGVGEPRDRRRLFEKYSALGCSFPTIVHPNTVVSLNASIEDGVVIGPYSTVLSGSRIGRGCCLLSMVNINHDITLHPWCLVGAAAAVGNGAVLEEGCHIAMGRIVRPSETIAAWSYSD